MPKKNTSTDLERLMLVIVVTRDPRTGRFTIEASDREDHGALVPIMKRDGSPTRFAASVHDLTQHALQLYLSEVTKRWGAELERVLVDVDELVGMPKHPMG